LFHVAQASSSSAKQSDQNPKKDSVQETKIEEIIVTAQKRAEKLQDVPIAITAVTAQRLDSTGVGDIRELNVVASSLNVIASAGHALPSLRGVGTAVVGPGIENPVALYVDGVYYADSSSALLTFNNIAQVEVLKGPQGTLFGRNATGGVIQVTTQIPSQQLGGRASASYGNYESLATQAYVTGGLTQNLAADLALHYATQGQGYGINIVDGSDANRTYRDFAVRSKLFYQPDAGPNITLIGDYANGLTSQGASIRQPDGLKPLLGGPFTGGTWDIASNIPPRLRTHNWGASARVEQDLGFADLVSISAYRGSFSWLAFDVDETATPGANVYVTDKEHQFSQELQLLSASKGRFEWVVGAYYFAATGEFAPSQVLLSGPLVNPVFPLDRIDTFGKEDTSSLAAFGEGKLSLTSVTRVTLGARLTHEKRTLDASQPAYLADGTALGSLIPPIVGAEITATRPTWRAVIDHKFSEGVLAYVSYNRGFKSGGFNASRPTDPPFKPERLDAYEVGVKSTLIEGRLRLNEAAYYYDYANYQAASFVLGNITVTNADAKVYGADVDLEASLTDKFRLDAGFALSHARFTSFPNAVINTSQPFGGNSQTAGDAAGNRLPYSPEVTFNIGGGYTTPVFGGSLDLVGNYYYNNGWYAEADNFLKHRHYNLVGASVTWSAPEDRFWIRLWGKNLTNAPVAAAISSSAISTAASFQPPRTYGLELGVKF